MSLINYIINFNNKQGDAVVVQISDYENYDPVGDNPITNIELIGVAPAFELETFNVSEDKFSSILGQRATIRFKSTNAVNFSTFAQGEDYRFFVRATYAAGTKFLFSGWLLMDENQQLYLPPGQPVTLYATDNLGSLKDIELSTFTGARPAGKYRLIEILAWCLRKTEGPFPGWGASVVNGIKVADNLFENNHDNTDNCPLNQTYVDVLTFEKNTSEYEDCYTVLEKILISRGARVCYYNNYWYILRIDEYKNSNFLLHSYDSAATYQSTAATYLDKYLDSDGTGVYGYIDFVEAQTVQRLQRPSKSAAITAEHRFPEEFFKNIGFERGAVTDDVPPLRTFTLDSWTLRRGEPGAYVATDSTVFIQRRYDANDYITEHEIVITPQTYGGSLASTDQVYIESEFAEICVNDKFTATVSWRVPDGAAFGNAYFIMLFTLNGTDGSWWQLGNTTISDPTTPMKWWNTSGFTLNTAAGQIDIDFTIIEEDEWQTQTIEAPPAPVTGKLYCRLHQLNQTGITEDNKAIEYQDLKVEYIPLVNGNYRKYTSQRFKMSTTDNYAKKTEQEYFLFDAPCKMFKGAMFYLNAGVYYLTSQWLDTAINTYSPSEMLTIGEKYLKWQTYYLWNQSRLPTLILNASLFGLDTANTSYAGLIHSYGVLNALSPTNNKAFIILSMRQDWHSCQWTATFAEVNWNANRRSEGDFEFKYLE